MQIVEDLKSGKLKLPVLEAKASSAKLESLSRILKVSHALTTAEILFLLHKSDKEIVDFCLSEGNEDLKVAILRVYQSSLSGLLQDSFSKALRIEPALTAKDIMFLTKATDGRQIIDFCLIPGNEASRSVVLLAYKDMLSNTQLSEQELLTFLINKEVAKLFIKQIEKVGLRTLFERVGEYKNYVEIVGALLTLKIPTSVEDFQVLDQYPWARQCLDSLYEVPNLEKKVVLFKVVKGPDGGDILALDSITDPEATIQDENFNIHTPTDKPSVPQENRVFNKDYAGKLIKGANGISVALSSASRGIKFAEEPSIFGGAELAANLFLLGCIVFPNSRIGKKREYLDVLSKGAADIGRHGIINATANLISNVGARYVDHLFAPGYVVPLLLTATTTAMGFYYSFKEFIYTVSPYVNPISNDSEQCEILIFSEHQYDHGSAKAISDIVYELIARGYKTFVFDESPASTTEEVMENNAKLIQNLAASINNTIFYSAEEKRLQEDAINALKAKNDLLGRIISTAGTSVHYRAWQSAKDVTLAEQDEDRVKKVKALCAQKPEHRKQVFLGNMEIVSINTCFKGIKFQSSWLYCMGYKRSL